ncbi:hypothetical protein GVAV_002058 [Gurleya vavrai]
MKDSTCAVLFFIFVVIFCISWAEILTYIENRRIKNLKDESPELWKKELQQKNLRIYKYRQKFCINEFSQKEPNDLANCIKDIYEYNREKICSGKIDKKEDIDYRPFSFRKSRCSRLRYMINPGNEHCRRFASLTSEQMHCENNIKNLNSTNFIGSLE